VIWVVTAALIATSWFMALTRRPDDHAKELAQLRTQINDALELDLVKRTVPLYGEAISLAPDQSEWYYGLADALEELGNEKAYEQALIKAVGQFPADVKLGVRLLTLYEDQDACQKLVRAYKAASKTVQKDEGALALYDGCAWKSFPRSDGNYQRIFAKSGDHFKVQENDKYGYLGKGGRMAIPVQFDQARAFIDGWAAVQTDGEWYFIDQEGDRIQAFPEQAAQELYSFSEGYAVAKIDGKYGFVDQNLTRFAFEYDDARPFLGGVAPVKKDGKWGLVDSEFKMVVQPSFSDVACAESDVCTDQDRVMFKKDGRWTLYDLAGKRIGDGSWDEVSVFAASTAIGQRDGKWEAIDQQGKVVARSTADEARALVGAAMPVRHGEEWTYVDKDGRQLGEESYLDAYPLTDSGEAVVQTDRGYTIIQFTGFIG
jgi:hypothetical protein